MNITQLRYGDTFLARVCRDGKYEDRVLIKTKYQYLDISTLCIDIESGGYHFFHPDQKEVIRIIEGTFREKE